MSSESRLQQLASDWHRHGLAEAFAADADRAARYRFEAAGLCLDLSRQFLDEPTLEALLDQARERDLGGHCAALFAGETVNPSEGRAALHMALRDPERDWRDHGEPVSAAVSEQLRALRDFVAAVHSGEARGVAGARFTDVVHIGIGGSHLGPQLVTSALDAVPGGLRPHFLSNVDPDQRARVLASLDPERTLVVVVSKSFTSRETLLNARAVRDWLVTAAGEEAVPAHFCAVSTNDRAVAEFGVAPERQFRFWDWVGGRYSVWSTVGLGAALTVGVEQFDRLLAGAAAMDRHFESAPAAQNLPVLLGLTGYWNHAHLGWGTRAVVPYADRLRDFPAYLQQLEMESNGKGVDRDGRTVSRSAPITWGGIGTDAQHSFFQLLHQGPAGAPVEFVLPARDDDSEAARVLTANCLAQAQALMQGRREGDPHGDCPGNRPSILIQLSVLDAWCLGALVVLYEHRVFVEAVLWGVNPFDQPGVELGKRLARGAEQALSGAGEAELDAPARLALKWLQAKGQQR